MAKRIKITERQLGLITDYQTSLNENTILSEGKKDVVLGIAMLMGLNLSGQNKAIAEKALNNPDVLGQINYTLSGPQLEDIAEKMETLGMSNAMEMIQKNSRKIKDNYAEHAKSLKVNPRTMVYNTDME